MTAASNLDCDEGAFEETARRPASHEIKLQSLTRMAARRVDFECNFIVPDLSTCYMEPRMKITFKQSLVALALTGAFGVAQAQTTTALNPADDLTYDLGADPTSENIYVVTHDTGSFSDVFTFSVTQPSDSISSAVSLEQPNLDGNGYDYFVDGGTFGLYSDADGDGMGGTLISQTTFGGDSTSLSANGIAAGSYYWAVAGNASGDFGGIYNFTTNTAPIPEPETYALMLAGLGLLGFVGKRRLRQSSASNFV